MQMNEATSKLSLQQSHQEADAKQTKPAEESREDFRRYCQEHALANRAEEQIWSLVGEVEVRECSPHQS